MASEQENNLKFVLEVEKNTCLYNYTLPEYVRKDLVEKAWIDVGRKVNLTGPECKEKWRNIRNVFVRNLKPAKSGSGAKKKKPYYLNDVMQFTVPFIKLSNSSVSGNLPIPINRHDDCIIDENSNDEDDPLSFGRQQSTGSQFQSLDSQSILKPFPKDAQTQVVPTQPSPQPSPWSPFPQERSSPPLPTSSPQHHPTPGPSSSRSYSTPRPSKKKGRKSDSNIDDGILQYFKAKHAMKENFENLEQNHKKMYLLSLLADVEPMSDDQMRMFKRRVGQVIEEILYDTPSTSAMENSELTVFYKNFTPIVIPDPDDSIAISESDLNSEKFDLS